MLYVGKDNYIQVYDDGVPVRRITSATDRGYYFTVNEEDSIISALGSTVYTLGLDGTIKSKRIDETSEVSGYLNDLREFRAGDGYIYRVQSVLGFKTIYKYVGKMDNVVYTTPLLDYLVLLTILICGLALFVMMASMVYITWRNNRIHT